MSEQQPTLWQAPRPASDEELKKHALPCDVQVGNTVFRAGTPLLAIVQQHRALYAQVYRTTLL
jgi:hypothetical protein